MLKLRKNKKGFTLVELIVVIAIMAVLAGTVAGVTVSQLNKQTDKTMDSEAKGIADFISTWIIEKEFDLSKATAITDLTTDLETQYGDKVKGTNAKIKVSLDTTASPKVIKVEYKGKQSGGKGDATYTVNEEGIVKKVPAAGNQGG